MYRKTILMATIILIGGCAGKADFTKGVSAEDKKLFSTYDDTLLQIKSGIRITEKGFYPNYKIPSHPVTYGWARGIWNGFMNIDDTDNIYFSNVASYLDTKKFNLKLFMDNVNEYGLKEFRNKLLKVAKKYPNKSFDVFFANNGELETLLKVESSSKEAKIILSRISKKFNERKDCTGEYRWDEKICYHEPSPYIESSPSRTRVYDTPSYSGSGSSSSRSSGCRIQTVYVPGGNGRTAQTRVCN